MSSVSIYMGLISNCLENNKICCQTYLLHKVTNILYITYRHPTVCEKSYNIYDTYYNVNAVEIVNILSKKQEIFS